MTLNISKIWVCGKMVHLDLWHVHLVLILISLGGMPQLNANKFIKMYRALLA